MKTPFASHFAGLFPTVLLLLGLLLPGLFPVRALLGDIRPSPVDERESRDEDATKKDGPKELEPTLDREGEEDYLRQVAREGEENLKEINRLLDEIQKNLASKETGSPTQEKQKKVVERMSQLLEELEQCCKSSGSKSGSQQTSMGQKQQKADEERKKKEEEELRKSQKLQAQQKKPQGEKEKTDGKVDNDRKADETPPEAKAGSLRDVILEGARRWGLLPPKLRDEVLFSPGKEAPREYIEIISKYYQRMSEFYRQSSGR